MKSPGQDRLVGGGPALVLEALDHGRGDVQLAERIAQARGNPLLLFQFAAEQQHGGVGDQRETGAVAGQLAVVAAGAAVARYRGEAKTAEAEQERARGIGDGMPDVLHDQPIEVAQAFIRVRLGRCGHLAQQKGVTADRALAEDHHAAGENIGALDRDPDRRALPGPAQVVARSQDHALAAMDVHGVGNDIAGALGGVVFGDCRRHGRFLALIDRNGGHLAQGTHRVGVAGHARQRLLDAFETTDG